MYGASEPPPSPAGAPTPAGPVGDTAAETIVFPVSPAPAPSHRDSSAKVVVYPSPEQLAAARRNLREEAATEMLSRPAPLFGRYRRDRELGRGGMGVVWLGYDQVIGIPVALKLVPEELAASAHDLEALRKEVLRGIALTHPGIVRVYGFERDDRTAAIIMEYVDGKSLADLQAEQPDRCFDPEQVRPWLEQLCTVLDYAHGEARIAHRDLKPRNLMINSAGRLKVADFGIASSLCEITGGISVRNDSAGTPSYMSPQQAMGSQPTITDDIYSLGATMYDLLAGKPPFYRGNVIAQLLHEPPESMNDRRAALGLTGRAEIPAAWERAIAACLAKDPSLRPTSGAALLQLLDAPLNALVPYAPRPEIPLESLKLTVVPLPPPHKEPPPLATAEVQVLHPVARPRTSGHPWQVEVKPRETFLAGILSSLRHEALIWIPKIVTVIVAAGVFYGVFRLAGGQERWAAMWGGEPPQLIYAHHRAPVRASAAPAAPAPPFNPQPGQTYIVEVRAMRAVTPPGQILPPPPSSVPPTLPAPPQGAPRSPR